MRFKLFALLGVIAVIFAGLVVGTTRSAHASTADPAVWVGSPFNGNWPNSNGCPAAYPSDTCSLPSVHRIVYYNPVGGYLDDWAADIGQGLPAGTGVYLYAAPQTGGLPISVKVETVGPACASGVIGYGGYRVTVAFYYYSTRIGTVTYAHINPALSQGSWISRWGTFLGTVGSYTGNSCWTGTHVHLEMSSQHNYACYNRGWAPGQYMNATNFIGFIGGNYASAPRQPCP